VSKVKTTAEMTPLIVGAEGTIVRLKVIPFGKDAPVVYEIKRHRVGFAVGRGYPLLSLFTTERDWVAWTPEGYYAASPGGEKLMGWRVSNGPDKMTSFYPAAQFRSKLYRPDVIKRLLEAGDVEKALALADKERS
jgi:hypothetical protein